MEKITCQECHEQIHAVQSHLAQKHPGMSLEDYRAKHPHAPLLSEVAKKKLQERREKAAVASSVSSDSATGEKTVIRALHEVFELGEAPAAKSAAGRPIPVTTFLPHEWQEMVPEKDHGYIYGMEILKNTLMCIERNMPFLLWGHMGTGKSTLCEQIAAFTNRPCVRIQHTLNTEESHVIGQWVLRAGEMIYQPGWLPLAMRNGWLYVADEYDFAVPHVLSLYQPVLEGKPLIIKDACEEWRVVKPHPNFRIAATGNTNGTGDETGLYQGTQIQNAANYERFAVVMKVDFPEPEVEKRILVSRQGLSGDDADKFVKFANMIRTNTDLSMPITPRSLNRAAEIGKLRGDFRKGIELAYVSRLSAVEREVAKGIAQRVFG